MCIESPLEGGVLRALSNGQISYLISPVSMRGGRFIAFRYCDRMSIVIRPPMPWMFVSEDLS